MSDSLSRISAYLRQMATSHDLRGFKDAAKDMRIASDRIDALLAESEAVGEMVPATSNGVEGLPTVRWLDRGIPPRIGTKLYATPQPSVPDKFLLQLRADLLMRADQDGYVPISGFLWDQLEAMIAAAKEGEE